MDIELDRRAIRNIERTGYPDGQEPVYPHCPVCGSECETIYKSIRYGDIIGCDACVEEEDPWDDLECFPLSKEDFL